MDNALPAVTVCGGVDVAQLRDAAQARSTGFDFVRIDFYLVAGQLLFGKMTSCPGSGLDPFDPVALDMVVGQR
jgi:hypothetical protein